MGGVSGARVPPRGVGWKPGTPLAAPAASPGAFPSAWGRTKRRWHCAQNVAASVFNAWQLGQRRAI